ncbi:hypothetical protein, partial [Klebsiella pneumoniae]|uniref:hypothetical protein n=1 Tax=Klebsiella pneumoniae TaxID=573 RepID=UPI00405582E8
TQFNVSDRLVKLTNKLVKEQGILPELNKKSGTKIKEDTVQKVIQFYEDDENSRLCPVLKAKIPKYR